MGIICKDMRNIFVIQGDSLQRRYTFYDKDKNIITDQQLNSVLFSCKRLNYEQFLAYDDGAWVLTLTSDITSNFKQCRTSYDITLYFESEQVSTQVYRAEFNVLKKDMIEDVEVSGEGESVDLDDIDVVVDTNINIIVSGSKNHDELEHRDFDNQHPMSAITGLEDALQGLDNDKQDNINDLNFIRDGANKGNTAVQPSQLSVYRTSALQDQIDNGIQSQIDALAAASDVVDIVGTYAELLDYDTQHIHNNDIIKVIADETHSGAPSYYRRVISSGVGIWVYVGSESVGYTKAEADILLGQKQDKITEYLKSASVSGNTLNLVKQDGTTLPFTPQGGGGEKHWQLIKNAVVPSDPSTDTSGVTWVTNANGIYRFVIDNDNDGNPFSYKKVRLIAKTPSKEAGAMCTENWKPLVGIDIPTPSGNDGWVLMPYANSQSAWASVIVEIEVEADGLVKTELDGSTNVVFDPMPNYYLDYSSKHFENRSLPSKFESNPPASITNVVLHTDKPIKPGVIVELYAEV